MHTFLWLPGACNKWLSEHELLYNLASAGIG